MQTLTLTDSSKPSIWLSSLRCLSIDLSFHFSVFLSVSIYLSIYIYLSVYIYHCLSFHISKRICADLDVDRLVEAIHLVEQLKEDALHLAVRAGLRVEPLGRDRIDFVDKNNC